jgi:hypothetical protein
VDVKPWTDPDAAPTDLENSQKVFKVFLKHLKNCKNHEKTAKIAKKLQK